MATKTIEFPHNARTVYTAVRKVISDCGSFRGVTCDDRTFRVRASHGLPLLGENVTIKVVAIGAGACLVEVLSSDKLLFNVFKWGNNKRNVGTLMDFIQNEVYRLLPVTGAATANGTGCIRLVKPDIRFS